MKYLKNIHEHLNNISAVSKRLLKIVPILLLLIAVTSCTSVRVAADYDKNANFNDYKSFAFFKTGIDKAEISDLDKRRILRAIETELLAKGFTKSENPDLLVSIFTKSRQKINIYNNGFGHYGYGWRWSPFYWGHSYYNNVSTSTEGTLYIDLIDSNKKELVWQGMGTGYLVTRNMEKKEERFREFVSKIMEKYPPGALQ
ncbi:DUF4136 domain-containing protein [Flavobacteriaceae bacterium AH-315-B10]|nr:DUF4136 domain-containing protein [Flavobacteriaceae bacterium AH-315-B10]